jgi:hypothetical protein
MFRARILTLQIQRLAANEVNMTPSPSSHLYKLNSHFDSDQRLHRRPPPKSKPISFAPQMAFWFNRDPFLFA